MLAIIGTIIGFLSSIVGPAISLWDKKMSQLHEIEMFKLNVELTKIQHQAQLETIQVQGDIAEVQAIHQAAMPIGVKWVDALNATVRPVFTYVFFACYVIVKYFQVVSATTIADATTFIPLVAKAWGEEDMAIFCTIVAFWFGNRTFGKMLGYEGITKPPTWVIKDLPKIPNAPGK